jgi:hypothetical protein
MRFAMITTALLVVSFGARAGEIVEIDGLKSKAPDNWKAGKPASEMQRAVLTIPKVEGDPENATLTVFYFGPGGGGGVDANVKRWNEMFKAPAGDKAKVENMKVGDVEVTTVDVQGTYLFKARPIDTKVTEKPDFRMVGVVFASKNGPYFMRFVGPAKTMEKNMGAFTDWLKNFK